jgi:ABC-type nitrate/sulfonate/bicarbonate transport system permease component
VPVAILAAWQLWTVHASSQFFPRLSTILVEFRDMWLFSQFGTHVVPSLQRIALGFVIGAVAGVALGIPIGLSRWARVWTMPHIEYWRAIPPPALLPISILLLHSIGNVQKVSFIAFFCLFPVLLNTIDGVRNADPMAREVAQAYRIRPWRRVVAIVVPGAAPQIMAGLRVGLQTALLLMVVSELVASTSGIGFFILQSQQQFEIADMWAGIIALGLLGCILNGLFGIVERRVLRWYLATHGGVVR